MKAEFNSRVDLQREVIKIVNQNDFKNKLSGLSKHALDTWFAINDVSDNSLKICLITISEKLFFIANKSQDQVTEEYKDLQISVRNNITDLKNIVLTE